MGTTLPFFTLSLFLFSSYASATQGIVGFGITLYQDLCCQACHDSLSTLYLNCTTFSDDSMSMGMSMDMSMDMMGTTSPECYASNIPWLQTMAYCIQQNCNADGYPAEKQASCFSTQAVAGAATPTFKDSLPATAPTVELGEDEMWLNVTSLVNKNIYYKTHGTLGEFARSEYIHTRYSVILYLVVIGICLVAGIFAQTRSTFIGFQKYLHASTLWAKLQQYIFLPALFGSRRLEPLPAHVGYVPSRALSIFISIYVIMNIILSSVSIRSFQPNTWFLSPQFELCEYVGNRTGTLSLVNLSIAILFAGRNNVLIAITGWSQTAFLTLHRWAARVAAIQAVVHSIVYTLAYFEPGYEGAAAYAKKAAEPFYWWGIIATIALSLATAVALLPLRTKFYEIFLITHIVLVILALIGCWYHLVPHFGYVYGYQVWLYISFAFWAFDRLARVARVAYYNRLGSSTAVVEAIPDCDVMQVTISPRVAWDFGPGQHSFLYLPSLGYKFWESHPFSIAGWKKQGQSSHIASTPASLSDSATNGEKAQDAGVVSSATEIGSQPKSKESGQPAKPPHQSQFQDRSSIQFLIRAHSGMTSNLQRRLHSSPSRSSMEISIYTEGPYAGHRATLQPLLLADTVLCIVGGIGITNALGFVQEYMGRSRQAGENSGKSRGVMANAKRFILAWSAREIHLIEHVKQNFLVHADDAGGVEYSFWCTGHSDTAAQKLDSNNDESQNAQSLTPKTTAAITAGRMNIGTVIRSSLEVGHQTTVLVCGPGNMADEATREVVSCVKEGFKVDLVEEAFAW
ncbi:ferric reductase like transmembrane component-domain-containing protein [Tricladium varicosporioides]|nr:ferric reductase like transmembrane component-domain-containing protein [Hymenoscyphus varicosporioides]